MSLRASLDALATGPPLDLAVIGGGINGCAIAREAAGRGLRVALFEQDDFGFGTTWRSTKLIHGGLRYLEHGEIRLVFESLRERAWLLKTRPHLVRSQRFLLPVMPWTRRPAWELQAGLSAYDALAWRGGLPRHRGLGREGALRAEPTLASSVRSGFMFWDARALAPERLALELALEARAFGGAVFNHAPVRGIGVTDGKVRSIAVSDGERLVEIPTRAIVNAGGPWVDAVAALLPKPVTPVLGLTKGTHIVLELARPLPRSALFSTARSDGRVFFVVPQGKLLLIGTTDDRYEADPSDVQPTPAEAEYLLEEADALLPGLGLNGTQVRYAYAGLRPLPATRSGPEAAITRRHLILDHAKDGAPGGLLSIAGGKLSTFRPLASQALDRLGAPGAATWPVPDEARLTGSGRLARYGVDPETIRSLGTEVLCQHSGVTEGEIRHVMRHELAVTLSDIVLRRTGMGWASCRGLCATARVAAIAASESGWDEALQAAELTGLAADVDRHLPAL